VNGWDDPRMPTIAGLRRRGYTPEAIRDFCARIGVAKKENVIDMAMLEHTVREDLNKRAPRAMAVVRPITVVIENYPEDRVEHVDAVNNPEDVSAGTRKLPFSRTLFIESDDFMEAPPKKVQDAILSRLKVQAGMDIAERRMPQDGRATVKIGDSDVDIRISAVPTNYGERIVLRLLDKSARLYGLEEIGLESDNLRKVEQYITYQHGIILVTGPTGSGKSTTLYAALQKVNSSQENVITLEDPIEYHIAGISQIQINEKKGLTFAKGLRHLLRQDPDIMMVGEIRDVETARIAIQAALTGHLVYSTLHTNDAASTMTRLVDIGIEPYLVASSVICVIAQRLVRRICPSCREEQAPTVEELRDLKAIGLSIADFPNGKLFHGRGCPSCFNTGYIDRTGIYEVMPVDEILKDQIMDRKSASVIKKAAIERGCHTLRMDGAQKVIRGVTTPAEVLRVTQLDAF